MITKNSEKPPSGLRMRLAPQHPCLEALVKNVRKSWKEETPSVRPFAVQLIPDLDRRFRKSHECIRSIRLSLMGSTVLDLGAGNMESMISIAQLVASLGASEYIAIDSYVQYSGARKMLRTALRETYPGMKIQALNEDMLLFISRMEDASANVVVNGIEGSNLVGNGSSMLADQYMAELASEIARVVPPGGVAFGVSSPTIQKLRAYGFRADYGNPGYVLFKPGPEQSADA